MKICKGSENFIHIWNYKLTTPTSGWKLKDFRISLHSEERGLCSRRTITQSPSTPRREVGGWESKDYHTSLQSEENGWWVGVEGLPPNLPPLRGPPISLHSEEAGWWVRVKELPPNLPLLWRGWLVGGSLRTTTQSPSKPRREVGG